MSAMMSAFERSSGLVVLNLSFVDHDPSAASPDQRVHSALMFASRIARPYSPYCLRM
jgi:hypothetical protein